MKIINLTGNNIAVRVNNEDIYIPSEQPALRVEVTHSTTFLENGAKIKIRTFYGSVDLPEEQEGVYYLVNTLPADHPDLRVRKDILIPRGAIKDANGRVVSCKELFTTR